MKLGMGLRNMGDVADRATLTECAQAADAAGLESLWVFDHVAIPPEESEGSGGLYLEPLATLAYVAGCTQQIKLGTGVLVVPYRPALITARWLATIQALSGYSTSLSSKLFRRKSPGLPSKSPHEVFT